MSAGVCGGACACSGDIPDVKNDAQCAVPSVPPSLDENGKCPCGKSEEDCCHAGEIKGDGQEQPLGELCDSHEGGSLCGGDEEKPA